MIAFASNHPTSCKWGIFRGETTRHLLNCSNSDDFYSKVNELRDTLLRRGYPYSALPHVDYDEDKRRSMLEKLQTRDRFNPAPKAHRDVVVFKCPYGVHIRRLGIHKECKRLIHALRSHLGRDFLQDTRVVLAHPVTSNLFLNTIRYNYIPSSVGT